MKSFLLKINLIHVGFLLIILITSHSKDVHAEEMAYVSNIEAITDGATYNVSWDSINTVISHDVSPAGSFILGSKEYNNGKFVWYEFGASWFPLPVHSSGTMTWADLMKEWIKKNGSSGHGIDRMNSGNFDHGYTCIQFGVKEASGMLTPMPGTSCVPVPPSSNVCKIENAQLDIPFGQIPANRINESSKVTSFNINCKIKTKVKISFLRPDGIVPIQNESGDIINSIMSVDGREVKNSLSIFAASGSSSHQLMASLKHDGRNVPAGNYKGSGILQLSIE